MTNSNLGPFRSWEILEEYPFLSDYELIVIEWEDFEDHRSDQSLGVFSGWNIQKLFEDKDSLQAAQEDWEKSSMDLSYLNSSSTKENPDKAVDQFENKRTRFLNTYAKVLRITAYSKRWWNEEEAQARRTWAQDKRRLSGVELRQA